MPDIDKRQAANEIFVLTEDLPLLSSPLDVEDLVRIEKKLPTGRFQSQKATFSDLLDAIGGGSFSIADLDPIESPLTTSDLLAVSVEGGNASATIQDLDDLLGSGGGPAFPGGGPAFPGGDFTEQNMDYQALDSDSFIVMTDVGIVTLPLAGSVDAGKTIVIKNRGSYAVTVKVVDESGDTIDDDFPSEDLGPYASRTLVSDGNSIWLRI